jgi:hypothetical protein
MPVLGELALQFRANAADTAPALALAGNDPTLLTKSGPPTR